MKVLIFYSGGKDSQASMIFAVKKYGVENCEAVFCDTGWESPETYSHIKETTNQIGIQLVTLKSKKFDGMIDLAIKKTRFPSTNRRFCTSELKSIPAIDYVLSKEESLIVIEGIRGDESFKRSKMEAECMYFKHYFEPMENGKTHSYRKKDVIEWCKKYDASKFRPIFKWTADETVKYILDNGQQPNILYYQGFSRVGCFPCIMARHKDIIRINEVYPERIKYLIEQEMKVGRTFFSPSYIPDHAKSGKDKNGNTFCTVEDVMTYLERKNATGDLFEGEGDISCMSYYGLCE